VVVIASRALTQRVAFCALLAYPGGAIAAASAQSANSLASLTIPADQLPAACSMRPDDVIDHRASTNPWIGTEPLVIAAIREGMGAVTRVPDAPLSRREETMFRLQLANGVAEAYGARYRGTNAEFVTVYAVTFDQAESSRRRHERPAEPRSGIRITAGRSEIVVLGKGNSCYDAVVRQVQEIVGR
jgi:hypothetical protein